MTVADEAGHRHATWFELFFDVIFVFALAEVVDRLGEDPNPRPRSVLAAFGLFLVVQWAWVGHAYYATRYEADDLPHRLLMLLSLLGAGAITLGVDEVPRGPMLPIGYLIVRGVLLLLYFRGRPPPGVARAGTLVYLIGFGFGWLTKEVRLLLAGSATLWLVCGLGLYWLAIRVSRPAALGAGYGIASVWAIALAVSSPFLVLVLLSAAIATYAVLFTAVLGRERPDQGMALTTPD